MRQYGQREQIVTDRFPSYRTALRELDATGPRSTGRWRNNRVENSHLPLRRRKRAMLGFRRMRRLQKFAAVHASVDNLFNHQRRLSSRDVLELNRAAAFAKWRQLGAA